MTDLEFEHRLSIILQNALDDGVRAWYEAVANDDSKGLKEKVVQITMKNPKKNMDFDMVRARFNDQESPIYCTSITYDRIAVHYGPGMLILCYYRGRKWDSEIPIANHILWVDEIITIKRPGEVLYDRKKEQASD